MDANDSIYKRKNDHIEICLSDGVNGEGVTTGFEKFVFTHQALPEIDFSEIDLSTKWLGKEMVAPFLISSMTGGTEKGFAINRNLAEAAQEKGWALGLGSTRAAIEHPEQIYSFQFRKYAPTIPIIANLGAIQLNYGYGLEECKRIIDFTEADALVLHLNSLQEIIQSGGDTNFRGLFNNIEKLCSQLSVPVGVKEVGWGINGEVAVRLYDAGVKFIDVAGAGGTSWSQVEKLRSEDPMKIAAAEAISDWGIPTSDCIIDVRKQDFTGTLIASGGMNNGVEAAKAIALGADLVGFGRSILFEATDSVGALISRFGQIELGLKVAMFGIGVPTIKGLKETKHLKWR